MNANFQVINQWDGTVVLRMQSDIAKELMLALRRYNEYRIADGINRDSGWADLADALEAKLSDAV